MPASVLRVTPGDANAVAQPSWPRPPLLAMHQLSPCRTCPWRPNTSPWEAKSSPGWRSPQPGRSSAVTSLRAMVEPWCATLAGCRCTFPLVRLSDPVDVDSINARIHNRIWQLALCESWHWHRPHPSRRPLGLYIVCCHPKSRRLRSPLSLYDAVSTGAILVASLSLRPKLHRLFLAFACVAWSFHIAIVRRPPVHSSLSLVRSCRISDDVPCAHHQKSMAALLHPDTIQSLAS